MVSVFMLQQLSVSTSVCATCFSLVLRLLVREGAHDILPIPMCARTHTRLQSNR